MWNFSTELSVPLGLKDASKKGLQQLLDRKDLGFFNLELMEQSIEQSLQLAEQFKDKPNFWIVGLGGSSLGSKALATALLSSNNSKKFYFLDNVDSEYVEQNLSSISSLDEHLFVFISKSGSTLEVLSLLDHCNQYFKEKGQDLTKHMVIITESKESPMRQFAKKFDIATLSVPAEVGGRFSVFTPVGLFPAACMGIDISQFKKGFQNVLEEDHIITELASLLLNSLSQQEFDFYLFQYSDRLFNFGLWFQQLWSESLGKARNNEGEVAPTISTFIPLRGSSDQHSVLQQIAEGQKKKLVGFVRVEASEKSTLQLNHPIPGNELMKSKGLGDLLAAAAIATQQSLSEMGHSTFCLKTDQIDPQTMGYLMGLSMLVVGTLGEVMRLNAFDQPGVESGKRITRRVLQNSH
ncbi:MAG: glucose-6-phosphate isomerase [Bdellovibrionales bacterium]|nr:glucose-6-phosphate isomerase [Bdellovibrionales bacterium]